MCSYDVATDPFNVFIKLQYDTATQKNISGPLSGIEVAVKDNINVKGFATSAGTPCLTSFYPKNDAEVVAKLKNAGVQILYKTNMHELALGTVSNNPTFGQVKNPHDPTLTAGGSSGGSAAAVALGIVKIALGTDTGGSCRIPASFCGCIGYRPTTGRYPSKGVLKISPTRDTVGILASDLNLIQGFDRVLATIREPLLEPTSFRLGIPADYFLSDCEDSVLSAFTNYIDNLAEHEKLVIEIVPMKGVENHISYGIPLVQHEATKAISEFLAKYNTGVSYEQLASSVVSNDVRNFLTPLSKDMGFDVNKAHKQRSNLRNLYQETFASHEIDALVYPCTPILPFSWENCSETITVNGKDYPTLMITTKNTNPGSFAGMPSMSLPVLHTEGRRLPIGLGIECLQNEDHKLFGIAQCLIP